MPSKEHLVSNSPTLHSTRRGRCAVLVLMAIVGTAMVATFERYHLLNDACQYESTARNIRDGNGVSTSCIFYGEQFAAGTVPAPQTVFPPFFPAAMAAVSAVSGSELHHVAFTLNLVSFLLSALVLYELCICLGSRPLGGVVSVACWLATAVLWHTTWWGLSEPPFMLLILISVRLLAVRRLSFALLAGLCASAAIGVRYAGLFLVAAAAVNYAILLICSRDKRLISEALLFGIPPTVTAWVLLRRNLQLVGSVEGGNTYELGDSLQTVVVRLVASGTELFGIPRSFLLSGSAAEYVAAVTITIGTLLVSRFLADRERRHQTLKFLGDPVRLLTIVFPAVHLAATTYLEYSRGSGISQRMIMPVLPFTMALFAALVAQVKQPRRSSFFVTLTCGVLTCGFAMGQYNAYHNLDDEAPASPILHKMLQAEISDGETVEEFLYSEISDSEPLLVNQPQLVYGILKRPVIGLATGRYNTAGVPWTPERVDAEIISKYGVRYVLLAKGARVIDRHTSQFFKEQNQGKVPPTFHCVFENQDLILFELTEPIRSSSL